MTVAELLTERLIDEDGRCQLARVGAGINRLSAEAAPYIARIFMALRQILSALLAPQPRIVQLALPM